MTGMTTRIIGILSGTFWCIINEKESWKEGSRKRLLHSDYELYERNL
jgi:hypothetical protein